jgi:hypothetical protein
MFKFYFLDDDIEYNTSFHGNTNTLYILLSFAHFPLHILLHKFSQ